MKGKDLLFYCLLMLFYRSAPSAATGNLNDVIQFLDGSMLHGQLEGLELDRGLQWTHPAASQQIGFSPKNVARIRFGHIPPSIQTGRPTCRFKFTNGDEIYGDLKSLEGDSIHFETWFGGLLEAPRESVQSLTFYPKGFNVLYEGPSGPEGWKFGRGGASWEYQDGTFRTDGVGTLGRDFKFPSAMSLEFDLAWTGQFSLVISLLTDVLDRFDYGSSSYVYYLGMGHLSLQRVQSGAGITSLGQVQIPAMLNKNKVHFEFRANKEESGLAVLVDGVLVQRWKDNSGFGANGSGAVFFSQMAGTTLKLNNIRVSEWDGKYERDRVVPTVGVEDLLLLANRDKVSGKLNEIRDNKLTVATSQESLEIPLPRITQIYFGAPATNTASAGDSWQVRALLNNGGSVSFQLEKWSGKEVSGQSSNFGPLVFNPLSFRQIDFNLDRLNASGPDASGADNLSEFDE